MRYMHCCANGWQTIRSINSAGRALRYLKDEKMAATPDELETGILYPIAIDSGRRGK